MALYAFDGTWNLDHEDLREDTNVVWFRDAYDDEHVHYWSGPGTRKGLLGHLAGGITGVGGRTRVKEALATYERNALAGDHVIDVIGFSRGSALALHFANSLPQGAKVRFLGMFDCVPSFGIPGNPFDIGWKLGMPLSAERVFHAMALDETRFNFILHRPQANPRLTEMWFRGVHSDVGGGNGNLGLSGVSLDWMFAHAHSAGVRLKSWKVAENKARANAQAPVSKLKLTSKLRKREPRPGDAIFQCV